MTKDRKSNATTHILRPDFARTDAFAPATTLTMIDALISTWNKGADWYSFAAASRKALCDGLSHIWKDAGSPFKSEKK